MKRHSAFVHSSFVGLLLCAANMPASSAAADGSTAVGIQNPLHLPRGPIPCERIVLGEPDDNKPCIARMPDGELLLTAFHQHKRDGNKVMEQMLLFPGRCVNVRNVQQPRRRTGRGATSSAC